MILTDSQHQIVIKTFVDVILSIQFLVSKIESSLSEFPGNLTFVPVNKKIPSLFLDLIQRKSDHSFRFFDAVRKLRLMLMNGNFARGV